MLKYKIRPATGEYQNKPAIFLIHGYGSNADDLFFFAPYLPSSHTIIALQAPLSLGLGSYAWYPIEVDANGAVTSEVDATWSAVDLLIQSINLLKERYSLDPKDLSVLGFSQGAILSYSLSFFYPNKVQHIFALSGYINTELLPESISSEIKTDYYCSHGSVDQVLPVEWARNSKPFLDKLSFKNVYSEYNVGHGVAPQNFYSFKTWITERL